MHIEDLLKTVGSIGVQVAFEGRQSLSMQIFVLLDEGLELLLNGC